MRTGDEQEQLDDGWMCCKAGIPVTRGQGSKAMGKQEGQVQEGFGIGIRLDRDRKLQAQRQDHRLKVRERKIPR